MENGERENKMKWRIENRKSFFFVVLYLFEIYFLRRGTDIFHRYPRSLSKSLRGNKERKHLMSRKEVSFEEQIMSKDKYTSIFSRKIEATVFIFHQIFCNARERMFTNS